MKTKSAKELGLPSGFRLTNSNKELIVRIACRELFTEISTAIAKEEWALFKEVYEFFYPQEMFDNITGVVKEAEAVYRKMGVEYGVDLYYTSARIQVGIGDTEIYLGSSRSWGDSHGETNYSTGFIKRKDLNGYYSAHSMKVLRCISPNKRNFYVMPESLQKKVEEFTERGQKHKNTVRKFKQSLHAVLYSYSSAIKLCNDHEEFIGWIRKSVGEPPIPDSCTDIPVADKMADAMNIIKEVRNG